jgi:hypothetical protein
LFDKHYGIVKPILFWSPLHLGEDEDVEVEGDGKEWPFLTNIHKMKHFSERISHLSCAPLLCLMLFPVICSLIFIAVGLGVGPSSGSAVGDSVGIFVGCFIGGFVGDLFGNLVGKRFGGVAGHQFVLL